MFTSRQGRREPHSKSGRLRPPTNPHGFLTNCIASFSSLNTGSPSPALKSGSFWSNSFSHATASFPSASRTILHTPISMPTSIDRNRRESVILTTILRLSLARQSSTICRSFSRVPRCLENQLGISSVTTSGCWSFIVPRKQPLTGQRQKLSPRPKQPCPRNHKPRWPTLSV